MPSFPFCLALSSFKLQAWAPICVAEPVRVYIDNEGLSFRCLSSPPPSSLSRGPSLVGSVIHLLTLVLVLEDILSRYTGLGLWHGCSSGQMDRGRMSVEGANHP